MHTEKGNARVSWIANGGLRTGSRRAACSKSGSARYQLLQFADSIARHLDRSVSMNLPRLEEGELKQEGVNPHSKQSNRGFLRVIPLPKGLQDNQSLLPLLQPVALFLPPSKPRRAWLDTILHLSSRPPMHSIASENMGTAAVQRRARPRLFRWRPE